MTREEARKAAEVMLAYADGKDIEYKLNGNMPWRTFYGKNKDHTLSIDFNECEYRVKQEPTYRPFKNKEECWEEMQKHHPLGWICDRDSFSNIMSITDEEIETSFHLCSMGYAFDDFTFADGTPFGIKEE